jgi:hypothetical protein
MKNLTAFLALLASSTLAISAIPASAGGWGHGPSFSQAKRFTHDTFQQVIVPVVTGTLNTLSAGAANSPKAAGGEMDEAPATPPVEDKPAPATVDDATEANGDDVLQHPFSRDPVLESLKHMREMPQEPDGPTIGRAREPIGVPSCGMTCPVVTDSPANDLPDPREEKSVEPPLVVQPILD